MRTRMALVAIMLLVGPISAQESQKAATAGVGSASCATHSQEIRQDKQKQFQYMAWAQGFMSGINAAIVDKKLNEPLINLRGTHPDTQMFAIRDYCEHNPSEIFINAVLHVFDRLPPISR